MNRQSYATFESDTCQISRVLSSSQSADFTISQPHRFLPISTVNLVWATGETRQRNEELHWVDGRIILRIKAAIKAVEQGNFDSFESIDEVIEFLNARAKKTIKER
jgi:hypothetical protein